MLRSFHDELLRQIEERKWFWQFEDPVATIPLYRRYLIAGGAMEPDAPWFREMWLCYCRHLHVWDSEPVEWRGGCHRSMPEGLAKALAAKWYPDIPEASHWANYGQLVFKRFLVDQRRSAKRHRLHDGADHHPYLRGRPVGG